MLPVHQNPYPPLFTPFTPKPNFTTPKFFTSLHSLNTIVLTTPLLFSLFPMEQGRKIVDLILEAEISTTEKNEKRKKRNPTPKLTEQGRKIVNLIYGGRNRYNWEKWKKEKKKRPAPKPTEQGRKIVDLICGGQNCWVCCSFVLDLRCHRWQGACQMEISFSYVMNFLLS